jgi:aspartate/methionine/tyrosine aminotransferase
MDFETLAASVRERTRAIVVVNPNNPTGSFLSRAEWDRLQVFAAQRDLAIIVDEVFCDYPLSKAADRVQTTAGSSKALTFALSGLSKVAGLPQLKLGWIVASGPNAARALEGLEWIADTFLSVGTPVQLSLASLLRTGAAVRTQIAERTAANLHRLRETLHGSAANVLQVDGGWYGTIQVPRTRSEEQWVLRLLEERDVLVQPGYFFDFEAEAFLVVSLLTPLDTFADGVTRLRDLL